MQSSERKYGGNRKLKLLLSGVLLAGVVMYLFLTSPKTISIAVKEDYLSLSYPSEPSFNIYYKDIHSMSEVKAFDIGTYNSGMSSGDYEFGVWKNAQYGQYHLAVCNGVQNYIVLKTTKGVYAMNIESEDATDSFYKAFGEVLKQKNIAYE